MYSNVNRLAIAICAALAIVVPSASHAAPSDDASPIVVTTAAPTSASTAAPAAARAMKVAPKAGGPITTASIVASQIGSWDCTITSPGVKDAQKLVVVWSPYGTDWIRGSVDVPKYGNRPAHKADFAFGYDRAEKLWVSVYTDSLGAYSISKSTASPTSKQMTFDDAFPLDSTDGPSLVTLGSQTTTIDSTWKIGSAEHASHEVCAKIPV